MSLGDGCNVPHSQRWKWEMKTVLFAASYYCSLKVFVGFWVIEEKQRQVTDRLWIALHL